MIVATCRLPGTMPLRPVLLACLLAWPAAGGAQPVTAQRTLEVPVLPAHQRTEPARLVGVQVQPDYIPAGVATHVTIEIVALDPGAEIRRVDVQRVAGGDLGQPVESARDGRERRFTLQTTMDERDSGAVQLRVLAGRQDGSQLGPLLAQVQIQPGTGTPTGTGPAETRDDLGIRIVVPPGWSVHEQLRAVGGPLNLNTFASQYEKSGIIPPGQAAIDITRVPLRQALNDYIRQDLQDTGQQQALAVQVGGTNGSEISYVDQFSQGLSYGNVAVYVPRGQQLYKFYLVYHQGDPQRERFGNDFQNVLRSVQFAR
jgi:hypothetical protein